MADYRNEYIKRGDVLDKSFPVDGYISNLISAYDVVDMPPADVVEVVRCKDCIHGENNYLVNGLCRCIMQVEKNGKIVPLNVLYPSDHFCSNGEMRAE